MSQPSISHHDALFKTFLADIDIARDFLQAHLPRSLRITCDFATLTMTSGSFIEDNLRSYCSDMLYSLHTSSGTGYVYCLIEHQSRPEKLMAFRLMRYSIAAMHRHLEQGNDTLPVVIPLLFYHGKTTPYPFSTLWLDCFADPEMAQSIYSQAFPLVDITALSDEEILTHRRVALMELVQKHIRSRDLLEMSPALTHLLNTWPLKPALFRALMYYMLEYGNTSAPEQFIAAIAGQLPGHQEDIMTIAQQLRSQAFQAGKQEGKQEGEKQGRQQGRQQERLDLARQFLAHGVERSIVKTSTGLSDTELNTLVAQ
ncbi:Rpn family recombination-promoting nuclease/putative transposase [Biostraticola tofi]|uniref:Putative transposase/invertase (TIGR01784 family) n=2 Tax=Biostraticola tofi TaxID=466109 RepID=A0A4R3YJA6_9GAMM|nr:Rpn family recombination-promoting nuclease/putative transposase [Biostraticola tofi]TCV92517.1 putative transposase/invertase (TIGR01784 family) [Biostraticola tofi]